MANEIATYLKYANLQMAAEARLDLFGNQATAAALIFGNDRSSKFTQTQADQFIADNWTVVDHKANTSTGFSGTLFKYTGATDTAKGLTNGELVLSFRSTEFIDDAARDNQATNDLEIKSFGWAFGQIADMQAWYGAMSEDPLLLQGKNFSVTGYSLGGHLATAFTQMRAEESFNNGTPSPVNATYTFNGAGVGKLFAPSLTQVIESFRQRRQEGANANLFTNASVRAEYRMSHENRSAEIAINSVAACARKQGVLGRFDGLNNAFKHLKALKTNPNRLRGICAHVRTTSGVNNHA